MTECIKIFNVETNELVDEFSSSRMANNFMMKMTKLRLGVEYKRSTIRIAMNKPEPYGVVKKLGFRVVKSYTCSECGVEKIGGRAFYKILCNDCAFHIEWEKEDQMY